jgi:hypothetical protein
LLDGSLFAVEVDVNIKLFESAPSTPTDVAFEYMLVDVWGISKIYILSAFDLDLEGFI